MNPILRISLMFAVAAGAVLLPTPNAKANFFMGKGHEPSEERKAQMETRMEKFYGQLGLSEEQKKLLAENKRKHKESKRALHNEMRSAMEALGEEFKKEPLDLARLNASHAQIKELRSRMSDERFHAILEVRKILTKEQFEKFINLLKADQDQRWRQKE